MASNDEEVQVHIEMIRQHKGLPRTPGGPQPPKPEKQLLFFVERAVGNTRCKLRACNESGLGLGDYRIALHPGIEPVNFIINQPGSADFYHISCFEKIADFSQALFFDLVTPVTRNTKNDREVLAAGDSDCRYLVDGGVERLVLEWKIRRRRFIDARDGVVPTEKPLQQNLKDLLYKAGTPRFQPSKVTDMENGEIYILSAHLAPNQSDGPNDNEVWNIFDRYLSTQNHESLNDRHDLSKILAKWKYDCGIALLDEPYMTDEQREEKDRLGPKAIRALRRLSTL